MRRSQQGGVRAETCFFRGRRRDPWRLRVLPRLARKRRGGGAAIRAARVGAASAGFAWRRAPPQGIAAGRACAMQGRRLSRRGLLAERR